jgi:hypothetical protein
MVLGLALITANLPFFSARWFSVLPARQPKTLVNRLGELVVFYLLVGGIALALENRAGQIAPQAWEFYAITVTLFVTLAFPGFVYRYLLRPRP